MSLKYIFVAVFFNLGVMAYSQAISLNVKIHDIEITESSIFFKYIIRNEYKTPIWFHTRTGIMVIRVVDGILFFEPVAHDVASIRISSFIRPRTLKIYPSTEISGYFREDRTGRNFLSAEYLDLTLVFTPMDIKGPLSVPQYGGTLLEHGVLFNQRLRIEKAAAPTESTTCKVTEGQSVPILATASESQNTYYASIAENNTNFVPRWVLTVVIGMALLAAGGLALLAIKRKNA